MVRYTTPLRSTYVGATVLIIFGGIDRDDHFLNDVWWFCVDNCPEVQVNKRTFDSFGIAVDYLFCPPGNCRWEEKGIQQEFIDWIRLKEQRPTSLIRRGIVPSRPAGRYGHTSVMSKAKADDFGGTTDIMVVFGGQSPNCTDYCVDLWYYDIVDNWWVMVYGEWWGETKEWQRMWDYSAFNLGYPEKRWGHTAVVTPTDYMFIWGGHTTGQFTACCGYDERVCSNVDDTGKFIVDEQCGYLYDMWATNLAEYTPFESKISQDKHATQSSTLGTGVAQLAVDGNTDGHYSDTWQNSVTLTNTDSQAWWQVDLAGPNLITNVTIFNRVDAYSERLTNFYVLLSTVPFLSDRLQDLLEDPLVHKTHLMYVEDRVSLWLNREAQYVRIQLAGTNYLSLAEVEIWGHPPVNNWQNIEGMKRWAGLRTLGDFPLGRYGGSLTMVSAHTALLFGGSIKEDPFFLDDFWTVLLPEPEDFQEPVAWTKIEPLMRIMGQDFGGRPWGRYGHSALYSPVCSIGYDLEVMARAGTVVLDSLDQGVLPVPVYPGDPDATPWCRGQLLLFGGSTSAERDPGHPAYPEGYLGDLWIYNMSSNTISELRYSRNNPHPVRRRDHAAAIDRDYLYLFGGTSNECLGGICGDMWVYNVSGPGSCPLDCSGHGACEWGFCICDRGFKGEDCGGFNCPNSLCTYSYENHHLDCLECNNKGVCNNNGTCICDEGWKGEDCSVLSCPGNCSGHGSCKMGGVCECDANYGGPDCFEAFCVNNCTQWGDPEYDSGTKGDCIVQRIPPCCGTEPDCVRTITSPVPCIERDPQYIPNHNVSRTCVCADTYFGVDCGTTIADATIAEALRNYEKPKGGCFAVHSSVVTWDAHGVPRHIPLSDLRVGDRIASMDGSGRAGSSEVIWVHEHVEAAATRRLFFRLNNGSNASLELTDWHAVPTVDSWRLQQCRQRQHRPDLPDHARDRSRDQDPTSKQPDQEGQSQSPEQAGACGAASALRHLPALFVEPGMQLVRAASAGGFEGAVVTKVESAQARVRYVVTHNDRLLVDGALGLSYSSAAGWLETLPFRALHALSPGILSHPAVASSLATVLESPLLQMVEGFINSLLLPLRPTVRPGHPASSPPHPAVRESL